MTKPAVLLTRYSSDPQDEGDSEDRQTAGESTKRFLKDNDLKVVRTIALKGESAFTGKHLEGEFGDFLAEAKRGDFPKNCVLVVEDFDRLSRLPMEEATDLARDILRAGLAIGIVTQNDVIEREDLNDIGTLVKMIVCLHRAWWDSHVKGIRVASARQKARDYAADNRKPTTRACPRWLKWIGPEGAKVKAHEGRFIVIKKKAIVIRRIFKMALRDGINAIALRLNKEGIPRIGRTWKSNKHAGWTASDIYNILTNRAVIGEYTPQTKRGRGKRQPAAPVIERYYKPILSPKLFVRVQSLLAKRAPAANGRPGNVSSLFGGLLYHEVDQSPIHIVHKGDRSYLIPLSHRYSTQRLKSDKMKSRFANSGQYRTFPYNAFEWAFFYGWAELLPIEKLQKRADKEAPSLRKQLEHEIDDYTAQVDRYTKMVMGGVKVSEQLNATMVEIERRMKDKKSELELLGAEDMLEPQERIDAIIEAHSACFDLEGEERKLHRQRLKNLLAETVERIDCYFMNDKEERYTKWARLKVKLRGMKDRFDFTIKSSPGKCFVIPQDQNEIVEVEL